MRNAAKIREALGLLRRAAREKFLAFRTAANERLGVNLWCEVRHVGVQAEGRTLLGEGKVCGFCGEPSTGFARAKSAFLVLLQGGPLVELPVCAGCAGKRRRRLLFEWAGKVAVLFGSVMAMGLVAEIYAWHSVVVLLFGGVLGGVAGGVLALYVRQNAQVIRCDHGLVTFGVLSILRGNGIVEIAAGGVLSGLAGRGRLVRKSEALGLVGALAVSLIVGGFGVYRWWHPSVRVMNLGEERLAIFADGREIGRLNGIQGEIPNAGILVRVPRGGRVLEARKENGELVDRSFARVGSGRVEVYVPEKAGQCFWIEQEIYGSVSGPRSSLRRLTQPGSFLVVEETIDAFFQGNPGIHGGDRVFSGGIRRALRYGSCKRGEGER